MNRALHTVLSQSKTTLKTDKLSFSEVKNWCAACSTRESSLVHTTSQPDKSDSSLRLQKPPPNKSQSHRSSPLSAHPPQQIQLPHREPPAVRRRRSQTPRSGRSYASRGGRFCLCSGGPARASQRSDLRPEIFPSDQLLPSQRVGALNRLRSLREGGRGREWERRSHADTPQCASHLSRRVPEGSRTSRHMSVCSRRCRGGAASARVLPQERRLPPPSHVALGHPEIGRGGGEAVRTAFPFQPTPPPPPHTPTRCSCVNRPSAGASSRPSGASLLRPALLFRLSRQPLRRPPGRLFAGRR